MATPITLSMIDYSGEPTRTSWHSPTLTAANLVAQTAIQDAIRLAIEAISLCNEDKLTAALVMHSATPTRPTNPNAQRELAVKVFYVDNVNGRTGTMTIPGPNLTALTLVNDEVVLADGDVMADFVTAFEFANSRDGNNITVTAARLVGRNN